MTTLQPMGSATFQEKYSRPPESTEPETAERAVHGGAPAGARHASSTLALWRRIYDGGEGLVAVCGLDRSSGIMNTAFYPWPHAAANAIAKLEEWQADGLDVFQCAHLLNDTAAPKDRRRTKALAAPLRAAYRDGDGAPIPPGIPKPTVVVESSPGRTQEYWVLTRPVEPAVGEEINRRIAYATGADPSGWDLTQLLRPPGFRNRKYVGEPIVTILRDDGRAHDPDELLAALPEPPLRARRHDPGQGSPASETADEPPITGMNAALWRGEELTYRADQPGVADRSKTLWRIACDAEEHGATVPLLAWIFEDRDRALGFHKFTDRPAMYRQQAEAVVSRERGPAVILRTATGDGRNADARGAHSEIVREQERLLSLLARIRRNGALKHYANTAIALALEATAAEQRGALDDDGWFTAWVRDVIAPAAGVSREAAGRHLKLFESWGFIERRLRLRPRVDADGVIGDAPVRALEVRIAGGPRGFLEALTDFIPPKHPGRPHRHCHPDANLCPRPCCAAADAGSVAPAEPDVMGFHIEDRPPTRNCRPVTYMRNPITSGSKDPPEGMTTCACCKRASRTELCRECEWRLSTRLCRTCGDPLPDGQVGPGCIACAWGLRGGDADGGEQ